MKVTVFVNFPAGDLKLYSILTTDGVISYTQDKLTNVFDWSNIW